MSFWNDGIHIIGLTAFSTKIFYENIECDLELDSLNILRQTNWQMDFLTYEIFFTYILRFYNSALSESYINSTKVIPKYVMKFILACKVSWQQKKMSWKCL